MDIEDRYCEECQGRLGLVRLCSIPSDDYIEGMFVGMQVALKFASEGQAIGFIMRELKGKANAETVARIVKERMR